MSLMTETDPHSLKEHSVIGEDVYIHSTHLTPQELYLLEQVYQELLPEYAAHVLQYETAREGPEILVMYPCYLQETNAIKAQVRMSFL